MASYIMPFAKAQDYREYHAELYAQRYQSDPDFRKAESKRKAEWYAARSSDPAWLAQMAARKRAQRAMKKKKK